MPKVVIVNLQNKTILLDNKEIRLFDSLLENMDLMHLCGGKGKCTSCKVRVLKGMTELSVPTKAEIKFYNIGRLKQDERLSCQVYCHNNLELEIPKEVQLPHVNYGKCL